MSHSLGSVMLAETCLRFVPSRVDGILDVVEAAVYPDRLELRCADRRVVYRFDEIAEWRRPTRLWRLFARMGVRPTLLPAVGERDWFHPPRERYFRFFTNPRITLYMPDEPRVAYSQTLFRRVQDCLRQGGFDTWDLG